MRTDELVNTYDQVQSISKALAQQFISCGAQHTAAPASSDRVIINITSQFGTNNNCGFNLANFKPALIQDYFAEVVEDYQRSFIGAFTSELFDELLNRDLHDVYFTLAKFQNNCGFSLSQNSPHQNSSSSGANE